MSPNGASLEMPVGPGIAPAEAAVVEKGKKATTFKFNARLMSPRFRKSMEALQAVRARRGHGEIGRRPGRGGA